MKILTLGLGLILSAAAFANDAANPSQGYPVRPDESVTPGTLCDRPSTYRYPEKIAYCERDVSSGRKKDIIADYEQMGYQIHAFKRENFKIDHLIPLCAGGSNDTANLWPQHKSLYEKTDRLEQLLCEKMAQGEMRQADAIETIMRVKRNTELADAVLEQLLDNPRRGNRSR